MKMTKEEFYESLLDDFFKKRMFKLEGLKRTLYSVMPIFGDIELEIEKDDKGCTHITVIDRDVADCVVAPEGVDVETLDEELFDMSTTVLKLHLDSDDMVVTVEHGLSMFTQANKGQALFIASLIGKKVDL